jgi:hypothetical protein
MLRNGFLLAALAAALGLATQSANAQATRTWVSGVGNDANPCSRTAPCKTFAGAISKTAAGGEINALDPGGFGAVTITKSITIDGGGGQVASILAAGTNGVIINAGTNDIVTLRNISINGVRGTPTGGLNGVRFLAGAALHIENVTIFGFTQNAVEINVNRSVPTNVFVTDSVLSKSVGGITFRNAGTGSVFVSLQRTTVSQNSSFGVRADGGGGAGGIVGAVADSMIAGNGIGVLSQGGPAAAVAVQVTRSSIVNSVTTGAFSNGTFGQAFLFLSQTMMVGNTTALQSAGGANGNLLTYQNNAIDGNPAAGAFTGNVAPK